MQDTWYPAFSVSKRGLPFWETDGKIDVLSNQENDYV